MLVDPSGHAKWGLKRKSKLRAAGVHRQDLKWLTAPRKASSELRPKQNRQGKVSETLRGDLITCYNPNHP